MLIYFHMMFDVVLGRIQALREDEDKDRGASALEWAIIAGISVIMAVAIAAVIYHVVDSKKSEITKCGNAAPGASCAP